MLLMSDAAPLTEPPAPRPRVLVVSDVRLHREGLALGLADSDASLEVVGAADGVQEALARIAELCPDVVLLDAAAAGGLALPRRAREAAPAVRVVVFALADREAAVAAWAEAGISGCAGRDASLAELAAAARRAAAGEFACSAREAALLLRRLAELAAERPSPSELALQALTPREREIVGYLEQGLCNKLIARRLGIGHATVKNHVHHILEKLKLRGRGEVAARLRRQKAAGWPMHARV